MDLFIWIYCIPLWEVVLVIIMSISLWFLLAMISGTRKGISVWRIVNRFLFLLEIVIVLIITIFSRSHTDTELRIIPFGTFIRAKGQPELYRTMLMNVLLFLPYGLFLPFVFVNRNKYNVTISILSSFVFSAFIEFIQYRYQLGYCELDDIIMNVIGTILGTMSYMLLRLYYKHIKRV